MIDKPVSPLRRRMIDDMTARRFTEDSQRDYVPKKDRYSLLSSGLQRTISVPDRRMIPLDERPPSPVRRGKPDRIML